VVIKKKSDEKSRVEFRDASLPGYEPGSREIEWSRTPELAVVAGN
jgi:hypothetical protein